jgi:hypothetical protein
MIGRELERSWIIDKSGKRCGKVIECEDSTSGSIFLVGWFGCGGRRDKTQIVGVGGLRGMYFYQECLYDVFLREAKELDGHQDFTLEGPLP